MHRIIENINILSCSVPHGRFANLQLDRRTHVSFKQEEVITSLKKDVDELRKSIENLRADNSNKSEQTRRVEEENKRLREELEKCRKTLNENDKSMYCYVRDDLKALIN